LPGKPDIVFVRQRLAIFCDGDFWHGRKWSKDRIRLHAGPNASYWVEKIKGNIARDKRRNRELKQLGWKVLRVWESDIRKDPELVAKRTIAAASCPYPPGTDWDASKLVSCIRAKVG
jgi:DNA mismatch endonuclease (patch repair protein)